MKKIHILIFALAISVSSIAQVALQHIHPLDYSKSFNSFESIDVEEIISSNWMSSSSVPNIIWESDFSDPTDWVLDNNGQNPPDYGWSIDAAVDGWYFNNAIASSSGGNFAELSNGVPQTGTQAMGVTYTMTTALPIDVFGSIGSANATLTFEEYGARFYDLQEVQVSTDGVNFVAVGDNLAYSMLTTNGGSAYDNPTLREINIATYIGTTPTAVWLRFSWTTNQSSQATNPNVWIAYGWYIDDVKIVESPANKITMDNEVMGGWWIDYLTVGGLGQDYTSYPLSQATANPYIFESVITNEGTESQDVTMHVDVSGSGSFSTTSNALTLASNEQDTVGASNGFTPTSTGLYTINMWGVADSAGHGTVMNYSDTATKMTMVTDYVYGKDFNVAEGSWRLNRVFPLAGGFEVSSNYDIYADVDLYAVDVHISNWSIIGAEVYVVLYEEDISGGDPILLAQSDNYAITNQDRGHWISIPFLSAQSLTSSTKMYRIAVGANVHPSDSVGVDVSSGNDPVRYSSDGLFDKDGILSGSTGATWWSISDIPMLRMNFEPGTIISTISNFKETIFNVYPNPSNGVFTISLDENDSYDVTINNALGQTVYTTATYAMETIIDLSDFDKGIYTVELRNGNNTITEKVIIE
jgi:hypothetical protein